MISYTYIFYKKGFKLMQIDKENLCLALLRIADFIKFDLKEHDYKWEVEYLATSKYHKRMTGLFYPELEIRRMIG